MGPDAETSTRTAHSAGNINPPSLSYTVLSRIVASEHHKSFIALACRCQLVTTRRPNQKYITVVMLYTSYRSTGYTKVPNKPVTAPYSRFMRVMQRVSQSGGREDYKDDTERPSAPQSHPRDPACRRRRDCSPPRAPTPPRRWRRCLGGGACPVLAQASAAQILWTAASPGSLGVTALHLRPMSSLRSRSIYQHPIDGGLPCPETETRECAAVDCEGYWSSWSSCDERTQQQTRRWIVTTHRQGNARAAHLQTQ